MSLYFNTISTPSFMRHYVFYYGVVTENESC